MNFYVLRRNQKLGPFHDSAVEEMSARGELRAGDLVCPEGEQNWLPVSRFLEQRHQRSEAGGTGTEADGEPSAAAPASVPSKTTFLRSSVEETDEATLTEAEREVIAGGRFVTYRYCWSLLVSFNHTSPPLLLRASDDGFGPAFRYSLISVFLGWWGIPGPVWAISTIRHNARGGKDVTLETLTQLVGHARAAAACARHQPGATPGALLNSLGGMMAALSLALLLGLGWVGWAFAHGNLGEPAPGPGSQEFGAANDRLSAAKGSAIFGNNTKSLGLADAFNRGMLEACLNPASGLDTNTLSTATCCEQHADRVVFLVQIPGLQRLSSQQRRRLADEAWRVSSATLTDLKAGFTGLRVAVGLRSSAKYELVLTGRYVREFEANNTGLRSRIEGSRSKAKLYPLFVPLEQLEAWKDE